MKKLILASASPRRARLLRLLDIPFEIAPSNANEALDTILPPAEHVREIAQRKTKAVVHRFDHALVLGADTVVALEDAIFEKPNDAKTRRRHVGATVGKNPSGLYRAGSHRYGNRTDPHGSCNHPRHDARALIGGHRTLCRHWGFYGQSRRLRRAGARLCIYTIYIRLLLQCGGFAACVLLEPVSPSGRAIALGDHTRK